MTDRIHPKGPSGRPLWHVFSEESYRNRPLPWPNAIRGISWAQPPSVEGAVIVLAEHAQAHPNEKRFVDSTTEEEFVDQMMTSVGRWMCHYWNLQRGGGPIAYECEQSGITNGIDVAEVILRAAHRYISGGGMDVKRAIAKVREYWIETKTHGLL